MKDYLKKTLIGGLLFLVPLSIILFIFFKVFKVFYHIALFIDQFIHLKSIAGMVLVDILTIVLILLVCFLFGLLAMSKKAQFFQNVIEKQFLLKVPGYIFFKAMTKGLKKDEENASHELDPVLIRFDDNSQLGFLIEENKDGLSSIYMPGAPNPWSGSVIYVEQDRISQLNITARQAIQHLQQAGKGLKSLGLDEQTKN